MGPQEIPWMPSRPDKNRSTTRRQTESRWPIRTCNVSLLVRGWSCALPHLENFCSHGLFHMGLAHPKEADAVRFIAVHTGLKNAAHLIDPQRIVEDFHPFRRKHVDCFVLPDRHLAAVVAQGRNATQQKERQIGRAGGNNEALDLYFFATVGLDLLGHLELRFDRVHQLGKCQPRDLFAVCQETERHACHTETYSKKSPKSSHNQSPYENGARFSATSVLYASTAGSSPASVPKSMTLPSTKGCRALMRKGCVTNPPLAASMYAPK